MQQSLGAISKYRALISVACTTRYLSTRRMTLKYAKCSNISPRQHWKNMMVENVTIIRCKKLINYESWFDVGLSLQVF